MAILGAVKPALAHFTQGVRKALQSRRSRVGPSAISIYHLLTTRNPRDVVTSGWEGGCTVLVSCCWRDFFVCVGGCSPSLRDWEEAGLGAGRGPPQGSLQELVHLRLPLLFLHLLSPGSAPSRSVLGGGCTLVQALPLAPERGAAGHAPCLGPAITPALVQLLTWAPSWQPPRSPCARPWSRLPRRILRDAQTWLTEPGAADGGARPQERHPRLTLSP